MQKNAVVEKKLQSLPFFDVMAEKQAAKAVWQSTMAVLKAKKQNLNSWHEFSKA